MVEVQVLGKKKNPAGTIVAIIFVIFFLGPMLVSSGGLFGGSITAFFSIIPIIIFVIVFFTIINSFKNAAKTIKKYNDAPEQKIEIPVEFFEQGAPVKDSSSDPLFNDLYGRKIRYYENGKPVFEHK